MSHCIACSQLSISEFVLVSLLTTQCYCNLYATTFNAQALNISGFAARMKWWFQQTSHSICLHQPLKLNSLSHLSCRTFFQLRPPLISSDSTFGGRKTSQVWIWAELKPSVIIVLPHACDGNVAIAYYIIVNCCCGWLLILVAQGGRRASHTITLTHSTTTCPTMPPPVFETLVHYFFALPMPWLLPRIVLV